MGIAYCLIRTSPQIVEELRGRPKAVAAFVYQDSDLYEAPKPSFFSKLFGAKSENETGLTPQRVDGDETDLDKSWHVVHYLLCGDAGRGEGPLALIGDDRHPLADIDLGLGKPNIISAEMVRAFADAASAMSEDDFLARYVPASMPLNDLYMGDVIERGDVDDIKEYAVENFRTLRNFVQKASDNCEAIITYYT
jgi:Domain of unknown function (DUF1877)